MMLGKVIRKYRKERNFTQEEMAERLGVTASAVNKWEREVTCPDIALLAPIARLLEISTDTLLSYRENLTPKEIKELMEKTQKMLKETGYGEAFGWARKQMEQYPNCEELVLNMAACFEAYAITHEVPEAPYISGCWRVQKKVFVCRQPVDWWDITDEKDNLKKQELICSIFPYKIQNESGCRHRFTEKRDASRRHTKLMKNCSLRIISGSVPSSMGCISWHGKKMTGNRHENWWKNRESWHGVLKWENFMR